MGWWENRGIRNLQGQDTRAPGPIVISVELHHRTAPRSPLGTKSWHWIEQCGWVEETAQWVKVLPIQAWGPEFNTRTHVKTLGVQAHICSPNTWEAETRGPLGLAKQPA